MTPYVWGLLMGIGGCLAGYAAALLLAYIAFCYWTRR